MAPALIPSGEKFSVIAVVSCDSEVTADVSLPDGATVSPGTARLLDDWWRSQLGDIRFDELQRRCNLVLIHHQRSETLALWDHENTELYEEAFRLFCLLQLFGVPQYDRAFALNGSVEGERINVIQVGEIDRFYTTAGSSRSPVTVQALSAAADVSGIWREVIDVGQDFARIRRGLAVLLDGLRQSFGQERLHQYVRAIEAAILPEQGKTRRQFISRCQTFAGADSEIAATLGEAFDMRSAVEHVHEWDRALVSHPASDREPLAMKRTRQIEFLACAIYRRILTVPVLREHFRSDDSIGTYWSQSDECRRAAWGETLDIRGVS